MTDTPTLPSNIEAEAALLGAMLVDNRCIDRVLDRLPAEDFFEPIHRRIYQAIADKHARGEHVNPVTLKPMFIDDEAMKQVGGVGYLALLTGGAGPGLIGVFDFAIQIAELATLRRVIEAAENIIAAARDTSQSISPSAVLSLAEDEINRARGQDGGTEIINPGNIADQIAASMGKEVPGVTVCTLPEVNRALGKLRNQHLIIIAGRPGMGKSALAGGIAIGAAANGHGTLFVSLEMSAEDLTERFISDLTFNVESGMGVPHEMIHERRVKDDHDWERFVRAQKRLHELPLRLIKVGGLTVPRLTGLARQTARQMEARGQKLGLVIVDYLQLMSAPKYEGNRVAEVSEISRGLKNMAGVLDLPVIALSQLSRAVEARDDKRPRLSDLRESGAIEQDADSIGFIYRPEYYLEQSKPDDEHPKRHEWDEMMRACKGVVELNAAKLRHGRTGMQEMAFYGAYSAMRGRQR